MRYEEWQESVKHYLEKVTKRKDIEVTAGPYRSYDVSVSEGGADRHPVVDFYSPVRTDSVREREAIKYAIEMLSNWEAQTVLHDKGVRDCAPFFEKLCKIFPNLEMSYSVIDAETHHISVERTPAGKFHANFDLWPNMTNEDVNRLTDYIREYSRELIEQHAIMVGCDY